MSRPPLPLAPLTSLTTMTTWLLIDLSVLLCVSLLTGIIIPQILLIAFRKNLLDEPDPRKIHKTEVPRLGGIAFFPSILLGLFLLYGFGLLCGGTEMTSHLLQNLQSLCFVSSGAILLYLTGMADDLAGVRYKAKFIMQTLSALFVIIGGLYLGNLHGFLWLNQPSDGGSGADHCAADGLHHQRHQPDRRHRRTCLGTQRNSLRILYICVL